MPSHWQLQPPLPPHSARSTLPCGGEVGIESLAVLVGTKLRGLSIQGLGTSSLTVCEASLLLLLLQLEEILLPEAGPSLVIVTYP